MPEVTTQEEPIYVFGGVTYTRSELEALENRRFFYALPLWKKMVLGAGFVAFLPYAFACEIAASIKPE